MAQSKSFFGLRRGSTKSLTFSTFNGKQVTKDRVTDVKNPRTEAQMINRMLNYTAMSAYSAMKEIVDHSFASKSYGLQSMRHFLSKNYSLLKYGKDTMFYSSYKGGMVPSLYLVSEGSLPGVPFAVNETDGTMTVALDGNTFADLRKMTGLSEGDYITAVCLTDVKETPFTWLRIYIPEGDGSEAITSIASLTIESNVNPSEVLEVVAGDSNKVSLKFKSSRNILATGTIIASAKKGDTWQRSTCYMQNLSDDGLPNYENALATYPVGASYILNGGDK